MSARPCSTPVAVALATVGELARPLRLRPDAERRASRIALRRAVRRLAGERVRVEIRHAPRRPPLARIRSDDAGAPAISLAVSLTHRDGRTAAIAAPAGAHVGIDIERLGAVAPGHERYFLTSGERERAGRCGALLWALKEAAWKALALDGGVAFHELELDVDGGGRLRAVRLRGRATRASGTLSTPWPGYVLATVVLEDGGC